MPAIIIGFLLLIAILAFVAPKKRRKSLRPSATELGRKISFQSEIAGKKYPERISNIHFHSNGIARGLASGDMGFVNLSYAKLIESLRQQNIQEKGVFDGDLEVARAEYTRFRETYGYEYPEQFLPPSQRKRVGVVDPPTRRMPIDFQSDDRKLKKLVADLKGAGHAEYPLLRKEYAMTSGMPYKDFSGWVMEQLTEKDWNALYSFVKELYVGRDEFFADHFNGVFANFKQKDFGALFETIDPRAIRDLQAFFVMGKGIDDFGREFWIAEGKSGELLAKVLCVYPFSINPEAFEPLMKRANKFIKEMRAPGDVEYWKEFPNYRKAELRKSYDLEITTDLPEKLRQLTLGERLHFFDFAHGEGKYWSGISSYKTRWLGVNEEESVAHMLSLGLFEENNDIEAILETTSKGELKEAAEKAGLEVKKSWTRKKLYENLRKSQEGEAFLASFLVGRTVLLFKEEYRADMERLVAFQDYIKRTVDLIAMI
ncbi:MAG: hypothetical protein P4L51_18240 [Puia sp.]|nr:hypothetical protein [Puia sp.]